MRLEEIYKQFFPAISVEFFPPRSEEGKRDLESRIPEIKNLAPAFCSVTYGAGGSGRDRTIEWVRRTKHEFGLETMCHLTCVGQSRDEIKKVLDELKSLGIENIIALRGDPPQGVENWTPHPDGFSYAAELVKFAAEENFSIAVAGFPEIHPEAQSSDSDIQYLKEKVDAGAVAVITQLFFDNKDYFAYVERATKAGINVPIVPGILPCRSKEDLIRFANKYARTFNGPARIPEDLLDLLEAAGDDTDAQALAGIEWAYRQSEELLRSGAPGIHYYCMNKSNVIEILMTRLRNSGLLPSHTNKL